MGVEGLLYVGAFIIRKGCCGAHYTVFIVRTPPPKKKIVWVIIIQAPV